MCIKIFIFVFSLAFLNLLCRLNYHLWSFSFSVSLAEIKWIDQIWGSCPQIPLCFFAMCWLWRDSAEESGKGPCVWSLIFYWKTARKGIIWKLFLSLSFFFFFFCGTRLWSQACHLSSGPFALVSFVHRASHTLFRASLGQHPFSPCLLPCCNHRHEAPGPACVLR
jgi:hypothetical protein